jgi:hypothetical protein
MKPWVQSPAPQKKKKQAHIYVEEKF